MERRRLMALGGIWSAELLGYAAATLTTLAFLPQLVRTLRTGGVRDLSAGMLALQASGCGLWFGYGAALGDAPLMLANGLTASMVGAILVMKLAVELRARRNPTPPAV